MANDVLLKMEGISKSFPGVKALDNVSLEVKAGTCVNGRKWCWKIHFNEVLIRYL